jgi:hypothetical protein
VSSPRAAQVRRIILATVAVTLVEALTWLLLRSQGNDLGGDQAHYLIAAQTLSHLSLHPLPFYQRDFLTHFIYRWPAGASVTNHGIVQTFPGPHGSVFAHGLGLPLLLSPLIALGSVPLGLLGMFAISALGLVAIFVRGSTLATLGRSGQVLFALVLAAPALWLASTQVYPDFVSGVLLGAALLEIALVEQRGRLSVVGATVIAGVVAIEPWLQVKNLAPSLCCVVVLALLWHRLAAARRVLVVMAIVIALSWLILAVYNQYYFSDLVGLPQPNPTIDLTSASRVLALLFDRHQGLLVQTPTVLIGLVGLWLARRTVPLAAGAASLGALAMVVINGTYTSGVPFGGTDLAGRFEWTALPMLLAWAPVCIGALERHRRRVITLAAVVGALWVAQGIPVLLGDHVEINAMIAPFAPWDPTLYPGWWPLVGQYLPVFEAPGLHLASTWTHLGAEVLVAGAALMILLRLATSDPAPRKGRSRWPRVVAVPIGATVVALVLVLAGPTRTLPTGPLSFTSADVGAPWTSTTQPLTTTPVELAQVGPGTYRLTLNYGAAPGSSNATATLMATDPQLPVVAGWFTPHHPTDAALLSVSVPPIDLAVGTAAHVTLSGSASHRQGSLTLTVAHQSALSFFVTLGAPASVSASLRLTKLSG